MKIAYISFLTLFLLLVFVSADKYSDCSIYGTCKTQNKQIPSVSGGNISGAGIPEYFCFFNGNNTVTSSNDVRRGVGGLGIDIGSGVLRIFGGGGSPTTYDATFLSDPNQFSINAPEFFISGLGVTNENLWFSSSENDTIDLSSTTSLKNLTTDINFVYNNNVTFEYTARLNAITLPTCNNAHNGTIARNVTKLYFCDGTSWNGLY